MDRRRSGGAHQARPGILGAGGVVPDTPAATTEWAIRGASTCPANRDVRKSPNYRQAGVPRRIAVLTG
ncbi:hypothetical protein [Amycolatopsis cynarae]|uniref:hypothetical protein n=1 Tax=Amycolatopsis cynarae TaxID=2995223 RepID=UPI002E1176A2